MGVHKHNHKFTLILAENRSDSIDHLLSCIHDDTRYNLLTASGIEELILLHKQHQADLLLVNTDMISATVDDVVLPASITDAPLIFLLPEDNPELRAKCFEAGAIDCICEPFYKAEFLARIGNHLSIRAQKKQVAEDLHLKDSLLHSVFPEHMIESLASGEIPQPEAHPKACVLFTDIVGFTSVSRELGPAESLSALNTLFFAFDEIIRKFEVERIKTIGDAYMAVSGVNMATDYPLLRLLMAAGKINELVHTYNKFNHNGLINWRIRTGLHQGLVIAGIVGQSKYAFDVWGNTVNIASRLENLGKPGKITVSDETYSKLPTSVNIDSTETKEVFNWGYMTIHHIECIADIMPEALQKTYKELDPVELIRKSNRNNSDFQFPVSQAQ